MMRTHAWWARLVRPRYGIIDLAAAITVVFACCYLIWGSRVRWMASAIWDSSLPEVRLADQASEPIPDAYRGRYDFTTDWFSGNILVWRAALAPYRGRPGVRYLEVGAFEGRSLVWMAENILTDPTSRAVAIDVFYGDYEARYRANVAASGADDRVETIRAPSQLAMRGMAPESFDIIYIDGSHATADVLEDAVLAWRLLKPSGLLIFDDYQWIGALHAGHARDAATDWPKPAIDAFCRCFAGRLDIIHNGYQVIVRKRAG